MVLAPNALSVDHLDRVVLARVVLCIAVVHGAILAFAQDSRSQDDLDLVAWESNHLATRLKLVVCSLVCVLPTSHCFLMFLFLINYSR